MFYGSNQLVVVYTYQTSVNQTFISPMSKPGSFMVCCFNAHGIQCS